MQPLVATRCTYIVHLNKRNTVVMKNLGVTLDARGQGKEKYKLL